MAESVSRNETIYFGVTFKVIVTAQNMGMLKGLVPRGRYRIGQQVDVSYRIQAAPGQDFFKPIEIASLFNNSPVAEVRLIASKG